MGDSDECRRNSAEAVVTSSVRRPTPIAGHIPLTRDY